MITVTKIIWDFSDTEFENYDYELSIKNAALPKKLKIKEEELYIENNSDPEEFIDEIKEYISDNYCFNVVDIEFD